MILSNASTSFFPEIYYMCVLQILTFKKPYHHLLINHLLVSPVIQDIIPQTLSITFKIVENLFFKEKKKIDEGKDQSDASTHKGMPKISSRPAEHRQETQNRFSRLPKEPVLLTSWLWTPGLQDCVTINFCHVSHPRKWIHAPRYPQSIAANSIQGEP